MPRKKHTSKEIEAVIQELEALGWDLIDGKGHVWGILRCPANDKECRYGTFYNMWVWSTPQNPHQNAKKVRQKALSCVRLEKQDEGKADG